MSRKKDRERYEAMRRINPDYKGFRGRGSEPDRSKTTPLEAIVCTACGRKRNVPVGIAIEQRDSYVCARCTDEGRTPKLAEAQQEST